MQRAVLGHLRDLQAQIGFYLFFEQHTPSQLNALVNLSEEMNALMIEWREYELEGTVGVCLRQFLNTNS